jgi:hypothetical protein
MLPLMQEHHKEQELYFGEDYYDENMEDSDEEEILDDPYAEAERLARIAAKNLMRARSAYMDDQTMIVRERRHSRDVDSHESEKSSQHHRHQADPTNTAHRGRRNRRTESSAENRNAERSSVSQA